MPHRLACLLAVIGSIAVFEPAAAQSGPSFDCAKAAADIEFLICDSPTFSDLDRALAATYRDAAAIATSRGDDAVEKLKAGQRQWLSRRNDCMTVDDIEACVDYAYRDRIGFLALVYDGIAPGPYPVERPLDGFENAPPAVIDAVRVLPDCDLDNVPPQLTVFDRDLGYELWMVPCWLAAYNAGSAAVVVKTGEPAFAIAVAFEPPPGGPTEWADSLTFPSVDLATGDILSFHKGRGPGDCGTYAQYRWDGRETVRLIEYREKDDCDGVWTEPSAYPLIYRAW